MVTLRAGDFAQRKHGRLVAGTFDERVGALGKLTGALGRHHHQLEAVIDHFQAIFYGNACHKLKTFVVSCVYELGIVAAMRQFEQI